MAVVFVLPLVALLLPAQPLFVFAPLWRLWFIYFFPPVRLLDLVLGCLMARIVRAGKWIPLGLGPSVLLAVAGYAVSLHTPTLYGSVAVTIVPLAFVISAAAASDLRDGRSPFRHKVMVWLGEISFAFYMVHHLIMRFAGGAFGLHSRWSTAGASGVVAAVLAASVLTSWLLYRCVESPAMRRFSGRKPSLATERSH
ncbi:hypothetical protein GCM10020000_79970 [Streptomyces olivoverticillatus]